MAGRLAGQLFVWENAPVIAIFEMVRAVVELLVRTTGAGALVVSNACKPKSTFAGAAVTLVPEPVSVATAEPPV